MTNFCKQKASAKSVSETVSFLKAIAEENRLRIICFLKGGEKCVCDIVDFLDLPQNLVSHHLKILREQQVVVARKVGLKVFYAIDKRKLSNIQTLINSLTK